MTKQERSQLTKYDVVLTEDKLKYDCVGCIFNENDNIPNTVPECKVTFNDNEACLGIEEKTGVSYIYKLKN